MVISVERMRKSDAYTIEHLVPSKELMYRAANGVYESYKKWEGKLKGLLSRRREVETKTIPKLSIGIILTVLAIVTK